MLHALTFTLEGFWLRSRGSCDVGTRYICFLILTRVNPDGGVGTPLGNVNVLIIF